MEGFLELYMKHEEVLSEGTVVIFLRNMSIWEVFFFLFGFKLCFKSVIFASIVICFIEYLGQATFILEKARILYWNSKKTFSFSFNE